MGLYSEYFHSIKEGKKQVEVRLNDEKRRKINVGDTIVFIKVPEQNEMIKVQVTELRKYDTFKDMYKYKCQHKYVHFRLYKNVQNYSFSFAK